ncbi:terpene synthase family protein [Catellatospora sp. KI3]|uniref:terpene synthase family protein n=1 Tax=Catellatospora sp. KI3 TaxID=3041620 RepID=UPI002482D5EB|nr:terpene synthase family protein [Catellatospora sp. KI3]MDI1463437.1 terpene synthase family protein [Catellatospora sp. KI3]
MPQDVTFDLPFPLRSSRHLDTASARNLDWVRERQLVDGPEAMAWYASWDMAGLAAYGYPHARDADELTLCADAMAFFFLFDDQFDGPLGRRPDEVARTCQLFIDAVHDPRPSGPGSHCLRAFRELWDRSLDGAAAGWKARAAHEWEYYFATYAHEAINRCRGLPTDLERFLEVRRGMSGTGVPVSLGERAARIDVPPAAFHSPQLRIMRTITVDVTLMCNDVYSLEKEAARGDMDNFVLVVEHENALSRAEAVERTRRVVAERCARFQQLAEEVPEMCTVLGLTVAEQDTVRVYAEIMAAWIRGYHEWETRTLRYLTADEVVPATKPGFLEALL